jgi:hypothetical protein
MARMTRSASWQRVSCARMTAVATRDQRVLKPGSAAATRALADLVDLA